MDYSMILQFIESLNRNASKLLLSQVGSERTNYGEGSERMIIYGVSSERMMN